MLLLPPPPKSSLWLHPCDGVSPRPAASQILLVCLPACAALHMLLCCSALHCPCPATELELNALELTNPPFLCLPPGPKWGCSSPLSAWPAPCCRKTKPPPPPTLQSGRPSSCASWACLRPGCDSMRGRWVLVQPSAVQLVSESMRLARERGGASDLHAAMGRKLPPLLLRARPLCSGAEGWAALLHCPAPAPAAARQLHQVTTS